MSQKTKTNIMIGIVILVIGILMGILTSTILFNIR